jgi:hypothetical protein
MSSTRNAEVAVAAVEAVIAVAIAIDLALYSHSTKLPTKYSLVNVLRALSSPNPFSPVPLFQS